jgi:hypothetical protein
MDQIDHPTDRGGAMTQMSRRIDIITGNPGKTVFWVDDRVLLTTEECAKIEARHSATGRPWAMGCDWVRKMQNPDELLTYGDEAFRKSGKCIIDVCNSHKRNLALVDFRTAHLIVRQATDALYLLDLQNLTEPLGYVDLGGGKTDKDWNWLIYGAEFAKHYNIPPHRFRFASRYRGEKRASEGDIRRTEDIVREALSDAYPGIFGTDTQVMDHSLRLDSPDDLEVPLGVLFSLNGYHGDALIDDAIAFAFSPPGGTWTHNDLAKGGSQYCAVTNWLGRGVDDESIKGLLLAPQEPGATPWSIAPRISRSILVADLKTFCSKLNVSVECEPTVGEKIGLPMQPGLPFLLALAALIRAMDADKNYHPPSAITLGADNDHFLLKLVLNTAERVSGKVGSATRLVEQYQNALKDHAKLALSQAEHLTSLHLVRLTHGIVARLPHILRTEKMSLLEGSSSPVATVMAEANTVTIKWNK